MKVIKNEKSVNSLEVIVRLLEEGYLHKAQQTLEAVDQKDRHIPNNRFICLLQGCIDRKD